MKLAGKILVKKGKVPVTRMFVIQLAEMQMTLAAGVRGQEGGNISGMIIQGIGPRPREKQATKETRKKAATLLRGE